MRNQFISFCSRARVLLPLAGAALAGTASLTAPVWGAQPQVSATAEAAKPAVPNWLDQALEWLERIYILIGGDPSALDKAGTADSQIATLIAFHANNPLPTNLSTDERAQLIQDIRDLHFATFSSDPGVSTAAKLALRATLESVWMKLGLPLSDL